MSIKNRKETSLLVNEWRKVLKEGLYPSSHFQTQNSNIDNLISECLLIEKRIEVNQLLLNEAINLSSIKKAASRLGVTAGSVLLALAAFAGNVDAKDVNTDKFSDAYSSELNQGDEKAAKGITIKVTGPGEYLMIGDDGRESKILMPSSEDVREQLKTVSQRMLDDLSNKMKSAGKKIIHASYDIHHLRTTNSVKFKPASQKLKDFSKKHIGSSKGTFPTNLTISNLSVSEISLLSEAVAVVYTCHIMPEKCEQQVSGTMKTDQARAEVDVVTGSGKMEVGTSSRVVAQFSEHIIEVFDNAKDRANSIVNEIANGASPSQAANSNQGDETQIIMQILPQLVNEDGTLNNQAIDGVAEGPIITDDDSEQIDSIMYSGRAPGDKAQNLSVRGSQIALDNELGN